jgi:AhpD family alkylhydroperoxidase
MAHIQLPIAEELGREFPGILGPMTFRPETAAPLNELVNVLLRGESTLSRGEREMIATHVSWRNDCFFCQTIHGAVAAAQLGHDEALVQKVKTDWQSAEISPKLKALLNIAGKVQLGGKHVTAEDIASARDAGRNRSRNPRHRSDCRCILHVQPLRRWAGYLGSSRSRHLSRARCSNC